MESSSAISTKTLSNEEGSSGNPEVKDGLHSSSFVCAKTSTMHHAGKATRYIFGEWGSWPILFPFPDDHGHSYHEISNDGQISLSVPPPPLYKPFTYSPYKFPIPTLKDDTDCKMAAFNTVRVEQQPGPDGEYDENFKRFARKAIEWYNNDKGRKFELHKLVEVVTHRVSCIICVLTMEAVDTDAHNDPPLTFKAEYWWCRIGAKDGVQFCHPI